MRLTGYGFVDCKDGGDNERCLLTGAKIVVDFNLSFVRQRFRRQPVENRFVASDTR